MQQVRIATIPRISAENCADELLVCVPSIMRFIRQEMRSHRQARLTVPHFRALVFLSVNEEPSLAAMADHLGLSSPATSRMVDVLVKRGLIERRAGFGDRRRFSLSLTARGRTAFRAAQRATQTAMARRFDALSASERAVVSRAVRILDGVFAPERRRGQSEK